MVDHYNDRAVAMKRVVLFKAPEDDYREALLGAHIEAVFVEPLQFRYVAEEALRERLRDADSYHGLVLTSPRAAQALHAVWDAGGVAWRTRALYAVGARTAAALQELVGEMPRGANSGSAAALAELVASESPPGARYLFPAGSLRGDTLPAALEAHGLKVDALTVYETLQSDTLQSDLQALEDGPAPVGLFFFSPSGCEYVHRQLQTFPSKLLFLPHFAIGDSTAHKIQNLGLDVAAVASKPCPSEVVLAVKQFIDSQGSLPT